MQYLATLALLPILRNTPFSLGSGEVLSGTPLYLGNAHNVQLDIKIAR